MRTRFLVGTGLMAALVSLSSFVAAPAAARQPKGLGKSDLRKYDDVITKDFTTQPGVFAVHRNEDKLYFEIPQDKFGRLFMWHAEVAKGPGGDMRHGSWGGAALGNKVLKFERRGNKVYVWKVGFAKRSDGKAVQAAIDASTTDSIIATFSVECEGKDRSAVINVSDTFIYGVADLPVAAAAGTPGANVDAGAVVPLRGEGVPEQRRGAGDAHLPRRRRRVRAAVRPGRRGRRPEERHRARPLQPRRAPRDPDAGPATPTRGSATSPRSSPTTPTRSSGPCRASTSPASGWRRRTRPRP